MDTRHAVPNRFDGDSAPNQPAADELRVCVADHCEVFIIAPPDQPIHQLLCSSALFLAADALFFLLLLSRGRHIRGWPGAREGTSPMGMLPAASLPSGRGRPRPDFLQPLHHSGPRRIIHPFRYPLSPDCSAQDQLCSCVFRDRVRPSDGHIF